MLYRVVFLPVTASIGESEVPIQPSPRSNANCLVESGPGGPPDGSNHRFHTTLGIPTRLPQIVERNAIEHDDRMGCRDFPIGNASYRSLNPTIGQPLAPWGTGDSTPAGRPSRRRPVATQSFRAARLDRIRAFSMQDHDQTWTGADARRQADDQAIRSWIGMAGSTSRPGWRLNAIPAPPRVNQQGHPSKPVLHRSGRRDPWRIPPRVGRSGRIPMEARGTS